MKRTLIFWGPCTVSLREPPPFISSAVRFQTGTVQSKSVLLVQGDELELTNSTNSFDAATTHLWRKRASRRHQSHPSQKLGFLIDDISAFHDQFTFRPGKGPSAARPTNWTRFSGRPIRRPSNGSYGTVALFAVAAGLMRDAGSLALRVRVDVAEEFGKRVRA